MTQFQQALIAASEGKLNTPTVGTSSGNVDYFGYQLAVHKYNLGIMSLGMKCRGITFIQIKKYYGLTGRTAKECLPQMEQLMKQYKVALQGYGDESIVEVMDMNSRTN
jgi:hypothetical protein